jgi:hypothetical protein
VPGVRDPRGGGHKAKSVPVGGVSRFSLDNIEELHTGCRTKSAKLAPTFRM